MDILSYNVWFDPKKRMERTNLLIKIIKEKSPLFVCLQEVIPEVLDYLILKLPDYNFSKQKLSIGYGVVILSKFPILNSHTIPFYTMMGRNLHYIQVEFNQQLYTIGTFHLESVFKPHLLPIKRKQFSLMMETMSKMPNCFLAGDTNIGEQEEDDPSYNLIGNWEDVYNVAGVKWNRYTYMRGKLRSRLDRCYFDKSKFEVTNYEVIKSHASDHWGIHQSFLVLKN